MVDALPAEGGMLDEEERRELVNASPSHDLPDKKRVMKGRTFGKSKLVISGFKKGTVHRNIFCGRTFQTR